MNDPVKLKKAILEYAPSLKERISWADPIALLGTIADVETDFGFSAVPRHERQFDFGGKYYNPALGVKWGSLAAMSFSSFQIMYPVAIELGLDPNTMPYDLHDDEKAVHWVIEFIKRRLLDRGCTNINQFSYGYNHGKVGSVVNDDPYVQKFGLRYSGVINKHQLFKEVSNV